MGIKCGIIGLPNVGKSTLFNALTASQIPAENYPFCTIDPNVGVVAVPDERLEAIATVVEPRRVVPAVVEFVDIAGLVEGASRGEGLGNQFLAHIRETHAIAHVVRCFENPDVVHVSGRIDPIHDIEIVATELMLADLETVERSLEKTERQAKTLDKEALARRDLLMRVAIELRAGRPARNLDLDTAERELMKQFHLLSAKPIMYVANVAEGPSGENPYFERVERWAAQEGAEVVAISAELEAELAQLDVGERAEFLADLGLEEPGLNRLIRAAYRLLGLQTFYTAQIAESRAWPLERGATAYDAAGEIHTDFQKGFVRAEVIGWERFTALGGEHGAREAGELRLEGKSYVVQEGDVIHFRSNV